MDSILWFIKGKEVKNEEPHLKFSRRVKIQEREMEWMQKAMQVLSVQTLHARAHVFSSLIRNLSHGISRCLCCFGEAEEFQYIYVDMLDCTFDYLRWYFMSIIAIYIMLCFYYLYIYVFQVVCNIYLINNSCNKTHFNALNHKMLSVLISIDQEKFFWNLPLINGNSELILIYRYAEDRIWWKCDKRRAMYKVYGLFDYNVGRKCRVKQTDFHD